MNELINRNWPGFWLLFGGSSWDRQVHAVTPGGEYGYGDFQGLYEWRDGTCIWYSGGDRAASGACCCCAENPGCPHVRAARLGVQAAVSRRRLS